MPTGQGRRRLHPAPDALLEHRRLLVAERQLFGWSARRIALHLAHAAERNPVSGLPWSEATIKKDMAALKAEWKARREHAVDQHIALHLAKLERVQEETWKERQWSAYLTALEQHAKLLGLNAPTKLAPTTPDGQAAWQPEQASDDFYQDLLTILTEHGGLHPNGTTPEAGERVGLE